MELRQYVNFPHLNSASGVTPAGVYVMKWSGFALRHIWLELFAFYLLGASLWFGWRIFIKEKRRQKNGKGSRGCVEKANKSDTSGTAGKKIKKHLGKLGAALILAVLIGWTGSEAFNNGKFDTFLKPTEGLPSNNAIPGLIVIRESGTVIGFLMAWFGGPVVTVAFAPTVLACAAMHSLKNPLKQSRKMSLNLGEAGGECVIAR